MRIINAHQNNLRNVTLSLPEGQLILVTGLSGSGKSSLAMEVIANEGYRFFLESLPAYNRQYGVVIPTAEVDEIRELPPVIRVEQSKRFRSVNTTFGTLSELASLFRILFARYSSASVLSKSLFSFNHPKGACAHCNGIGREEYIDLNKLIAFEDKTLREGAIATTLPNGYIVYSQVTVDELNKVCNAHGFNVDTPWRDLNDEQKEVILHGSERVKVFYGKHSIESRLKWTGLKARPREEGYYKGMLPIMGDILRRDRNPNILKFVSSRTCSSCSGARIKREHLQYTWQGYHFAAWMDMPLQDLYARLSTLSLQGGERTLVDKIISALTDMLQLGMEDYRLNTPSVAISSGDAQRLKLIRQVNSNLQGLLYIFDEPSIGLPVACQDYLLHIFRRLIQRGNTVLVVEHDLQLVEKADWIVELGPAAGTNGGEVIFNGPVNRFLESEDLRSPTLKELLKRNEGQEAKARAKAGAKVSEEGRSETLDLRPHQLSVISRKTAEVMRQIQDHSEANDLELVEVNDQPIGKTPRSNPATYTGIADKIRDLLAKTPEAVALKLGKGAFSFNSKTGRCEACEGAGVITLSMNVMGTINQVCPSCGGRRFKTEVLEVTWRGKHIAAIYDLSVSEASVFFAEEKQISKTLGLMLQLGLGYIKLGQPSNTLSGGEAQRIKLTRHFSKRSANTLLLLEEPGIGLHHQDVRALLDALHHLKKETAGIICFENHSLFTVGADLFIENASTGIAGSLSLPKIPKQQRDLIKIRGARTHHLKDLDLDIPKNKLTVITGISGAGKSSLVTKTLHGYGIQEMSKQFSTYQQARAASFQQFEADQIDGLTPTICITRKEKSFNERSDISGQSGIDKILRFAYSRKARSEGIEWSASHFSRNHELGKCTVCDGIGEELLPDLDKVAPDQTMSISGGVFTHNKALEYYGHPGSQYMAIAEEVGKEYGFDTDTPIHDLTAAQRSVLFYGTGDKQWTTVWKFKTRTREGTQEVTMTWAGICNYLKEEYYKTRKNKNIQKLTSLFTPVSCSQCGGSGLLPERSKIKIAGRTIHEVRSLRLDRLEAWLHQEPAEEIDRKLLAHMEHHMVPVIRRARELHVDHLQLSRKSSTLSGGEQQRIALITQLTSPLKGITYLLDEPSAGLSADNIPDLIGILKELIAKGNTVVVIEHDREIIRSADHMVELGPGAGTHGGAIIWQGTPEAYLSTPHCHSYFRRSPGPLALKSAKEHIVLEGVSRHTLVKDKVVIPVGGMTAIYGRSGIGKTTLVREVLIPGIETGKPVHCEHVTLPKPYNGAYYFEPAKLRSHSNTLLVVYLELLKAIAAIFAGATGLKARDFSYKTKTSQCLECKGEGITETSLDITASAVEVCEACDGKRYTPEILSHRIGQHAIADVLGMELTTLSSWLKTHGGSRKAISVLDQLSSVGLGHLRADQRVQTLSSGEQQRLLLLTWIQDPKANALYILDEPSIGLHYADIDLLFAMLEQLSEKNDVLVIDHNRYLLEKIGRGIHME